MTTKGTSISSSSPSCITHEIRNNGISAQSQDSPKSKRHQTRPNQTSRHNSQNAHTSKTAISQSQGEPGNPSRPGSIPLTSRFFFQNFSPLSRLRERDSLTPSGSPLRGVSLPVSSLSPEAMREMIRGEDSPLRSLPGGAGGIDGSSFGAGTLCDPSASFGQ